MSSGTPFGELASLCEALEGTTKRNEKKRLISGFLLRLKEDEIWPAVAFLVGKIFPEADSRVLEVGGQTLMKVLKGSKQATLVQRPLTILEVEKYFEEIATASSAGSRKRKEALLWGFSTRLVRLRRSTL